MPMNTGMPSALATGTVLCSGDNQKLIEETPSPAVNDEQRRKIIELAVDAVKKIGYVGVGTLEFLLDTAGKFLVYGDECSSCRWSTV